MNGEGEAMVGELRSTTRRSYAADWSLFTDWCAATDEPPLPADPGTVRAFLDAAPASAGTLRRRAAAIDHAHRAAGLARPGQHPAIRRALGYPTRRRGFDTSGPLARILIHGWPDGLRGRRDAALLALVGDLGLTYRATARLRADQIDPDRLRHADPPGGCPRCALARWLRTQTVGRRSGWTTLRRRMAGEFPATASTLTEHRHAVPAGGGGGPWPLLTAIDQHGWPSDTPLTVRSIGLIVSRRLAEPARRADMLDDLTITDTPPQPRAGSGWTVQAHAAAVAKRASDRDMLDGVDETLDEVAERADRMLALMAELLQ